MPAFHLPRSRRRLLAAAAVLGLLAAVAAYWWSAGEEARALRALPEAQRAGLYLRTMETLRTVCDPAPGRSMRTYCREQAEFALQFPECDAACRQIARRQMSLPRP